MQAHWTTHLKQKWYRNPAKSVKTLSFLVKEIPKNITKLEPKITRMAQSTHKQSDAGTLAETMLSDVQRNARTFSCKTLPLLVKEIPTDVRKLETKVIRKTRSTANQFDAGTLTEALPNEVERNAQTVSCEKSSLFVKQIPTDTTKLETKIIRDTIHKKINLMQPHWTTHFKQKGNRIHT